MASLFLITFLHWWSLWDFRSLEWTFPMFAVSLIGPSLWFFAATLINPRDVSVDPIDLASHFRDIRRPFLIVVLLAMVFFTIDGPIFGTEALFNRLRFAQVVILGLAGVGILSANDRIQAVVSLMTFGSGGTGSDFAAATWSGALEGIGDHAGQRSNKELLQ